MLAFTSQSGAGDFEYTGDPVDREEVEQLFFDATRLLILRNRFDGAGLLAVIDGRIFPAANNFNDEFYVLEVPVSLEQYEHFHRAIEPSRERGQEDIELRRGLTDIQDALNDVGKRYIRHVAFRLVRLKPPEGWRDELTTFLTTRISNQALFTFEEAPKITYQGLNFRSKTEVRIYDELIRRGVLVFPLPLAVMGSARRYKEPDFLVCHKGRWGILEIHGKTYHPPATAAKEHDRRREFTGLGVRVYEIFDAQQCFEKPTEVVSRFLQELERS